jgi:hypothetical protein
MSGTVAAGWLLHLALGGGLLLLLARLAMACVGDPARRQRLGEVGVLSALLVGVLALGPAWLPVTLPAWLASAPAVPPEEVAAAAPQAEKPEKAEALPPEFAAELPAPPTDLGFEAEQPAPAAPAPAVEAPGGPHPETSWKGWIERWLPVGYAALAGLFLARWLFAHAALAWLLRGAKPAPDTVRGAFEEMAPGRKARILVAPRARVPFSFGLFRPTMVLPPCLAEAPPRVLRWVLAHERAHLERRDGWAGLLLALGQAAFFYVPWFWWLRRQVRLCQEYVADAAAVAAGGRPEDYAEFLLAWAAGPRAPAATIGVFGSSSDLYRRIAMLLQPRGRQRGARSRALWIGGAFLALAVVLAGVRPHVRAAVPAVKDEPPRADKQPAAPGQPGKDEKKPQPKPKDKPPAVTAPRLPDIEKLLERLPAGADEAQVKELRRRLEAMRKQLERQIVGLQKQLERQTEAMSRQMERQADQMRRRLERGRLPGFGRRGNAPREGRLGVLVKAPESALVDQLNLPKDQGLVLEEVGANSAAAKAGLKRHDILLELGGKAVPSNPEGFARLLQGVKPNAPVDAVVLRKGKKETIKGLSLPEAKQPARPGRHGAGGLPLFGEGVDKLIR